MNNIIVKQEFKEEINQVKKQEKVKQNNDDQLKEEFLLLWD